MPVFSTDARLILGRALGMRGVEELALVREYQAHRVPWHEHRGFQLFFALNGAAAYEFRTRPPKPVEIPGGHFLVVPPALPHRGVLDACPPCELLFLLLSPGTRGAIPRRGTALTGREWNAALREFSRAPLAAERVRPDLARAVTALAEALELERQGHKGAWLQARLRSRVCQVLVETAFQLSSATTPAVDAAVALVEKHLLDHLAEPLHMAEVGAHIGLSRSRLFDAFKRATGLTPNDYLQRLRIERARGLLTGTTQSVTDIAFGTGYASSQYFSTVFRRFTGQTPLEYRKAHGRAGK